MIIQILHIVLECILIILFTNWCIWFCISLCIFCILYNMLHIAHSPPYFAYYLAYLMHVVFFRVSCSIIYIQFIFPPLYWAEYAQYEHFAWTIIVLDIVHILHIIQNDQITHIVHIMHQEYSCSYLKYCAYSKCTKLSFSRVFHRSLTLLLGSPSQGRAVDVPPPTAVTTECWTADSLRIFNCKHPYCVHWKKRKEFHYQRHWNDIQD